MAGHPPSGTKQRFDTAEVGAGIDVQSYHPILFDTFAGYVKGRERVQVCLLIALKRSVL